MTRAKNGAAIDLRVLMECAMAFQELAASQVHSIPKLRETATSGLVGATSVVTCAVNLGFAIELYLKALRVQLGVAFRNSHDLYELWSDLPQDAKEYVEWMYLLGLKALPKNERFSCTLAVGSQEQPNWEKPDGKYLMVDPLLQRARNLFASFRYLFEIRIPEDESHQVRVFDYRPLLVLCDAVRAEVMTRLE